MSDHRYEAPYVERLGERGAGLQRVAGIAGIVGLVLCGIGLVSNATAFYQSWFWAFLYWSGFTVGGLGILLMHNVVGGNWGVISRRVLEAAMRTLPLMVILFIPVLIGMKDLYPWAQENLVKVNKVLQHKQPYLNPTFFIIRAVFYFAYFAFCGFRLKRWSDQQDETGAPEIRNRMRAFSAPGVLFFVLIATFAYIDWVLSMNIEFYSTIYGGMILIGQVLQTFALAIIVLVTTGGPGRFRGMLNSQLLHDLGNLMFAFTIFWTYLSLSQLIIVWPANLPQELGWYLDRINGGWLPVAILIVFIMFLTPFFLLLSQNRKRDPQRLRRVAYLLLIARAVDLFWIVQPTLRKGGFTILWTDIAAFVGIGGIWIFLFLRNLNQAPLLPLRDPRLPRAVVEAA